MNCMDKIYAISVYQLRKIFINIRMWIIMILLICFHIENLQPILEFSVSVNTKITPYAFVHLVNDFIYQLVVMAGAVVIFSDAPFEDESYCYRVARAGKIEWALGQIMYIIEISVLYVFFLVIMSLIPLIGHLEYSSGWGKIWGTLAKTNIGIQFGQLFNVTDYMVSEYTPIAAFGLSVILEILCVMWLGCLIYLFNKLSKHSVGTFLGAFFVLLDICIANDWMNWANAFSPITLAQLTAYTGYNLQYHITLFYGIGFFFISIVLFSNLIILENKKLI